MCLAADRYVLVLPTSERGASHHDGEHNSRDQLSVHGLQRRAAAHTRYDDRSHLLTCPQSAGGPTVGLLVITVYSKSK